MLFTQFANFNALHTITAGRLNLFQHFRTKNLGTTTKIIPLDTSKLSKKGVDTLDELIDAFNVDVEEACSFFQLASIAGNATGTTLPRYARSSKMRPYTFRVNTFTTEIGMVSNLLF